MTDNNKYAFNKKDGTVRQVPSMEKPAENNHNWFAHEIYETHVNRLNPTPIPVENPPEDWKDGQILVEGVDVEIKGQFYAGAYMNTCAVCKKQFSGADKLWFLCPEHSVKAFPILPKVNPGKQGEEKELTTKEYIHLGISFSQRDQFKHSGASYISGIGFGYSCGYQDGVKSLLATTPPTSDVKEIEENKRLKSDLEYFKEDNLKLIDSCNEQIEKKENEIKTLKEIIADRERIIAQYADEVNELTKKINNL